VFGNLATRQPVGGKEMGPGRAQALGTLESQCLQMGSKYQAIISSKDNC